MQHPYASSDYAYCFSEWGQPVPLGKQTTLLARSLPHHSGHDLTGLYPRLPLSEMLNWPSEFEALAAQGYVSLAWVSDVFFAPDPAQLSILLDRHFAFKTHFIHDRQQPFAYDRHHRYEVNKAHRQCQFREVALADILPAWQTLYAELDTKHQLEGFARFSPAHFQQLAHLPWLRSFGAFHEDELIAAQLWVIDGDYAYYHLSAASSVGYRRSASYGLLDVALQALPVRQLDLGAAAGLNPAPDDGLTRFKRGFANRTAAAYFCGKILHQPTYATLCNGLAPTSFFPAYRQ